MPPKTGLNRDENKAAIARNAVSEMKILALDTSSERGSVAVYNEGKITSINYLDIRVTHSERLLLQVKNCLEQSKLSLGEINLIAFSNGPGSFTGLRIGLSTVKGLCMVNRIPLYPVNSILALAYNCYGAELDVIPFIDARMGEVYAAVYDGNMKEKKPPCNSLPGDYLASIDEPAIIIGDAVEKYAALIAENSKLIKTGLVHQNFIIASALIGIVLHTLSDGGEAALSGYFEIKYDFDAIADLEPYYLRSSQAEMKLK